MKDPHDIILRPVITEKTTDLMRERKYVFEVDPRATKPEIRKAVEAIFGVKVEKVNTMHVRGKLKRQGRSVGRTKSWKKAIVKLTPDSKTPDFFEGVQA
ncbi:50S ribosomal protein L23 [Brockia lithotrophica]|uniref:Large ribosomal subunit protein uL23 n=1 Tax=Brockia lithotrophica TaxID=933949 RepID=A0A660L1R4_9BACL|nr:50S ribosomal protein L23 [Brockia lithotrophica]RKQ85568.1 LSU ribosomal protein L23P [Brockia lithotrophica]